MCLKTSADRKKQRLSRGGVSEWKQCPKAGKSELASPSRVSAEVFGQWKKREVSQHMKCLIKKKNTHFLKLGHWGATKALTMHQFKIKEENCYYVEFQENCIFKA